MSITRKMILCLVTFFAVVIMSPTSRADYYPYGAGIIYEPDMSPFPTKDYNGDIHTMPSLLGNWNNQRNVLADYGVIFEVGFTSVLQHNTRGGTNTSNSDGYSGSLDYWLYLDTQRLGLWPGGQWKFHGETLFGNSPISYTGAVLPVNYDALLPEIDKSGLTTLSELYLAQYLTENILVLAGKIDPTFIVDRNVFANSERTQFQSAAFRSNPVIFRLAPYTSMAADLKIFAADWLEISFFALDTNSEGATRVGFDTAFESPQGTTYGTEWNFKINAWGQKGNQRFGYAYSDKEFVEIESDQRIVIPEGTATDGRNQNDYVIWYNFDQFIYTEDEDPSQGGGLFGRYGYSTGQSNPIAKFYSIGVGAKGILPDMDNDTCGAGYYYTELSNDFSPNLNLSSEQGVELYYNAEITKSVHFNQGIQWIVDPGAGFESRRNAIVLYARVQIDF